MNEREQQIAEELAAATRARTHVDAIQHEIHEINVELSGLFQLQRTLRGHLAQTTDPAERARLTAEIDSAGGRSNDISGEMKEAHNEIAELTNLAELHEAKARQLQESVTKTDH